ncbi:ribosomal RNA-processing protein 7 homolog A [Chelonus insularis]|uniref:ribosomal RNA-processing protein 7 homolog A n=1 Tax=Chelonus insularis TaxID=460826 RepID=UPI00158DD7CF|nr:ribosomal RNA-processing protein 7 homolog A [Chelonus insularis]XP_034950075.1 ribosomal RNA-processing protein 7 homolog A [Chelonus insularis]XP_034950076.1 ribosomal RNA-processing protein 7 homolog A [Chelonus insularis]
MVPEDNSSIGNFKTAWLKYDVDSKAKHQLFFKEHSVRNQELEYPRGKTLFVLNIPPYATLSAMQAAFSRHCGCVQLAKFAPSLSNKESGFKVLYIVFSKESGLQKALSLSIDFTFVLNTEDSPNTCGVKKWCRQYNTAALQKEQTLKDSIEKYIKDYDAKCEEKLNANNQTDDGWTTVTGKKKRGKFAPARKESLIEKAHSVEEQKKKKKQLLNFYTFQIRESKRERLVELRKKFELDKKKLQQLKSNRTFKPFG